MLVSSPSGLPTVSHFVRWVDAFVPDLDRAPDVLVKQRLLVVCAFVLALCAAGFSVQALSLQGGVGPISLGLWGGALLAVSYPFWLKQSGSATLPGTLLCVEFVLLIGLVAYNGNGFEGPVLVWVPAVPLLAAFLVGPRAAFVVAGLAVAQIGVLYGLDLSGYAPAHAFEGEQVAHVRFWALSSGIMFAAFLGWLYESQTLRGLRLVNQQLREAQQSLRDSEARFRGVFEEASVGIGITSMDNIRLSETNAVLCNMLGYSSQELAQMNLADLAHPEDRPRARATFRRLLRDNTPVRFETRYLTRDGDERWGQTTAFAVADATGQPAHIVGMVEDVTERHEAETARQRAAERLGMLHAVGRDVLAATSPEAIAASTLDRMAQVLPHLRSSVVAFDATHACILATNQDGVTGISSGSRFPLSDLGPSARLTADDWLHVRDIDTLDESAPITARLERLGVRAYLSVPLTVEQRVIGLLNVGAAQSHTFSDEDVRVLREIADMLALALQQRRYERRLLKAKDAAEASERLKSAMLTNMNHEVRTPLAGIMGLADVLQSELDGDLADLAHMIHDSGERLFTTLDAMLDLAQVESGTWRAEAHTFDLDACVREAVAGWQQAAQAKHLVLTVAKGAAPVLVHADAAMIRRALGCVLDNALKFTNDGEVQVRLYATSDGGVHIVVEDTGVGISEAFLPHVFEAFRQESDGTARTHEGNGLGLTLAQQLVTQVGGTLRVESWKGEGSRVTMGFPASAGVGVGRAA